MMINGYVKDNCLLWLLGQIAATGIGVLVWHDYGFAVGIAVGFALCVLVDIRGQL